MGMKLTTTTLIATLMATGVSTAAMAQTSVDGAVGGAADVGAGISADVGASGSLSTDSTLKQAKGAVTDTGDTAQENYGQLIQELRAGAETDTQTQAEIDAFDADAFTIVKTTGKMQETHKKQTNGEKTRDREKGTEREKKGTKP